MKIPVYKTITDLEGIDFFQLQNEQDYYLFTTNKKEIHVFDCNFIKISAFISPVKIAEIPAISPKKGVITVIGSENKHLYTMNISGELLWIKEGCYSSCFYDNKEQLWAVQKLDKNSLKCEVIGKNGEILYTIQYEDVLYDSFVFIKQIPNSDIMLLEHAAGQDGCLGMFFWIENNSLTYSACDDKRNLTCAAFSSKGDSYICLSNDGDGWYTFSYPENKESGEYPCDDEWGGPGYSLAHLDNYAIISSSEERYYFLDLQTMKIKDEAVFDGFPLLPISEVYKNLNEEGFVNPVSYFADSQNYIIGVSNNSDILICRKQDIRDAAADSPKNI